MTVESFTAWRAKLEQEEEAAKNMTAEMKERLLRPTGRIWRKGQRETEGERERARGGGRWGSEGGTGEGKVESERAYLWNMTSLHTCLRTLDPLMREAKTGCEWSC